MDEVKSTGNIRKLEESVINRIAAGEVIQRPANALKEMLENSLDAGSSKIQVTVKNGGLKLMQIQDNGSGIKREDMLIVCERFTTSKLEKFEDLSNINTHGFRGEALASISHVAHLTITTRTKDSKCAYKGSYCDGKLLPLQPGQTPEPKPCAGNQGTQITVEDLFYNVSTRLKALRSPSEEYHKIADMMGKYAIHNEGVSFTLKKYGESMADIRTKITNTVEDNISCIYGQSVAKELMSVECEDSKLGFKMEGYITSANYSVKKLIFLLFINHRLVDSSSIRKAIETVYSNYLPKNTHPFIYMSIEISAANVDVNVHPTKHEVHFLHEDLITEGIQKCIEDKLLGCNSSRTYYTQALLPGATVPVSLEETSTSDKTDKPYAHQMVRTDHKELKLDAFFAPESNITEPLTNDDTSQETRIVLSGEEGNGNSQKPTKKMSSIPTTLRRRKQHYRPVKLDSVKNLIANFNKKKHKDLSLLFNEHKFVGCVDQTKVLMQHQTRLYLVNMTSVTKELFYQLVLTDFANFDVLQLTPPPSLYELAILGLSSPSSGWSEEDGPQEGLAEYVVTLMKSKAEMLKDYFSFNVNDEGCLVSVPLLLTGCNPNLDKLPLFILRLATEVNWDDETGCFDTFAREYAQFYCIEDDPFLLDSSRAHSSTDTLTDSIPDSALMKRLPWRWTMEHVVLPCLRNDFVPLKEMAEDGTVLQISDLKDLYKVFERC